MPSGNQSPAKRPVNQNPNRKKRRRRGPVIRFRFGVLIFIWLFSLLICFGHYMYDRNFNPDKDVFVKKAPKAETSQTVPETSQPAAPAESKAEPVSQAPAESKAAEESSGVVIPTKINPVPESAPQAPAYLTKCAFLGDLTMHKFGEAGLLGSMNVYASEKINLNNYDTEYVIMGDGTTIRILSAMNSAKCPIYLMFGTESLATGRKADQIADKFAALVNALKSRAPATNIYILSIPPVTAAAEKLKPAVLNSEIDKYNSRLLEIANEANVYFVDTNTALRSDKGQLDPKYAEEDGIHLNTVAGSILFDYILKHVPA